MKLRDKIERTTPREIAGSRTSKRYDYQKDWSLCKILSEHNKRDEYVVLFDYLDDFVILNSESNPDEAEFFQIKTKAKGNYTTTNLLSSKKDKDGNSLLCVASKLYDNKNQFGNEVKTLCLVTNVNYNLELLDATADSETKSKIEFDELSKKTQSKIVDKIETELSISSPNCSKLMTFKVSPLSLEDSSGHTKGKLTEFLDDLTPGKKYRIPAIYQSLFDEIKNKTANTKTPKSYDELVKFKGLSKSSFTKILSQIGVNNKSPDRWDKIEAELKSDGVPYDKRKKLKAVYNRYEVEKMNRANVRLFEIMDKVQLICNDMEGNNKFDGLSLLESVNTVHDSFDNKQYAPYDSIFLTVTILDEVYY